MAFFGLKCEPKKWTPFVPPPEEALRLHISQVRARATGDRRIRRQSNALHRRRRNLPSRRSFAFRPLPLTSFPL